MFYIYTPYVTPSGKRVSRSKIIIYETVSRAPHTSLADNIRKFELTHKGWKTSKASGTVYFKSTTPIETVASIPLNGHHLLYFDSFDNAYIAKCILINRLPEAYLNIISTLTAKMNSLKSATPDLKYMSDAVPELFV